MSRDTLYIISTPDSPLPAPAPNHIPVHPLCRLDSSGNLLMLQNCRGVRGGIMMLSDCSQSQLSHPLRLCDSLLRLCALHHIRGLLLNFSAQTHDRAELTGLLAPKLRHKGITLLLPEYYAPLAPGSRVLIPCALSGGSLTQRIGEAVEHFGADRVVVALERCAEDFTLPALTGCGKALSAEQLSELMDSLRPKTHFSAPLCARYFTYCRGDQAHLVLYDDEASLQEKTACARRCGVFRFLFLQRDKQALFPTF